jgi:ABC-type iron transport system FetAB ATPase subunit
MVRNFEAIVTPILDFPTIIGNFAQIMNFKKNLNFHHGKMPKIIDRVLSMAEFIVKDLSFLDRGPYSFSMAANQIVCLSGPSGSGKSLLLRAIADLEPNSGIMSLDNLFHYDVSGPEWRKKVMYLPAESQWWQETVKEHFCCEPEVQLLADCGFSQEVLDWEISRLSSGEKQRLAIIRLLLHQPEVLLLDEPTASLDRDSVERIEKLFRSYLAEKNAVALWVSHDHHQIERVADRKFEMLSGGELRQQK